MVGVVGVVMDVVGGIGVLPERFVGASLQVKHHVQEKSCVGLLYNAARRLKNRPYFGHF